MPSVDECRGLGRRTGVEQGAGRDLRGLHVGLVERVDAEQATGDGGGVLPDQELRAEGAADADLVGAVDEHVVSGVVDHAHQLQVGELVLQLGGVLLEHDGQDALAELSGGLGDELLGPVGEADDVGAVGDDAELVAQGSGAGDGRAEDESRVRLVVDREAEGDGLGLVEQLADVDAGQAARHQAEGREGRVASADVGVGVEDPVSGLARVLVERRSRVGDHDDAGERVDARGRERGLEDTALAVGLDGGARLRRDDERGLGEAVAEARSAPGRARSSRAR